MVYLSRFCFFINYDSVKVWDVNIKMHSFRSFHKTAPFSGNNIVFVPVSCMSHTFEASSYRYYPHLNHAGHGLGNPSRRMKLCCEGPHDHMSDKCCPQHYRSGLNTWARIKHSCIITKNRVLLYVATPVSHI